MRRLFALLPVLLLLTLPARTDAETSDSPATSRPAGRPVAIEMRRAASTDIDLRRLPERPPRKRERIEREPPPVVRGELPGGPEASRAAAITGPSAPAPSPSASFDGLDFANWGAGHPPDPNGDVGPTYYIQTINTSIGIYQKSSGTRVAAFTFDTFMSQGSFGNLCDTDNFGDPVVLYDTFEDRWVITDFAFKLDASGNVINPPGAFQCFAVSKSGDPVSGGWNFYSINTTGGLGDYPKFGIWPDGLYMSANMFDYSVTGSFQNVRVYAFNKAQMYAGAASVQVVSFDAPSAEFTLLPANARLQAGTPPPGTPNYFAVVWNYFNAISFYKFHVDWNSISTSTFTGPFNATTPTSWADPPSTVQSPGNALDTLAVRLMMQNQYTNLGGVESLWDSHTVQGSSTSQAAVRFYQTTVTGGTVAGTTTQAATHNPDTTMNRFMPSLAIDRVGDLALGYSTTNSTTNPAIKWAGNLVTDPPSSITETEVSLINGTGTQSGNCGTTSCTRWGDYTAMTLDPDGCTFWYTNMYYAVTGLSYLTRVGSFAFPSCTTVGTGTVQGTVTAQVGGTPIAGATVALGSRTTTTDGSGSYSFTGLPAGTYPGITASAPGFNPSSVASVVVTSGGTTTQNFQLSVAPSSACLTDTSQADFQTGVPTNVDLTTSPGNVILLDVPHLDQHADDNGFGSGYIFSSTSLIGQTFTPGVTGLLTRVDAYIFCASCSGTNPNMILEVRTTSGGLPVMTAGGLLASSTIAGTSSGSGGFFTFSYGTPPTLTAGTQYGIVIRLASDRTTGTQAWLATSGDVYAGGRRVTCTTSSCSNPVGSNKNSDLVFRSYMDSGYPSSGTFTSSLKDSNPPTGFTTQWSTLSWTASVPASTTLRFQVAASNSAFGPFSFVGPDGTAATYFTSSGASLSQFNGNRYLEYQAYLATSDSTQTPTLNDVTVCYSVVAPASADLSISKTDGVTTATPGGSVTYTITAANAGPSNAPGSTVSDTFPASLTCTWTCVGAGGGTCTASGSGSISDTVSLPASGSVTYTASCAIAAAATGTLSNTATVTAPGGVTDPTPGNNSATDTDTLSPSANLGITNTDGATTATPGGSVTYTITASNAGPSNAPGSTVADTFAASLTCTWTCAGSGGGTCAAASGSGNINAADGLPAGGSVTYTASCNISAASTGSLSNTATVTTAGGVTDPTPGNNSATDTDTLAPSADLSITKTDGVTTATPGGSVTYTITASNAGPSNAPGATVADTFPASLTCTWTCAGAGGGTCAAASGSGSISATDGLPAGGSVTYTASCTISAAATGTLSNTATVTAPGGVTDPTPGNNSATDSDTLVPGAFVSGTKTVAGLFAVGTDVTYTVTLQNTGGSAQPDNTGNEFSDVLPAQLALVSANASSGTAAASTGTNTVTWNGSIAAGGSVTITITATIQPVAAGTVVSNQGAISYDSTASGTNSASALTDDPSLPGSADPTSFTVRDGFYFTVTPCRLFDTRLADGPYGGPALAAGTTRTFVAAGQCGLPADAKEVSINITVTLPTAAGDLRVYPAGIATPLVSIINYSANQTRANNGVVALGASGDFTVKCDQSSGTVQVIVDVNGYFK